MHRRSFLKAGSAGALAAGFRTEPLWACLRRDLRTGKRQCLLAEACCTRCSTFRRVVIQNTQRVPR
ncbi:MAG: twin-arginine translocation signal domain-containing protein [Acidobacteriia bacterium]|nr:twin-arginine translocation signal domain-containing protein [Terriglobia bacterium]